MWHINRAKKAFDTVDRSFYTFTLNYMALSHVHVDQLTTGLDLILN